MTSFPIEFQLLLLCSSYFSDKEKFLEFKNSHQIDWSVFLALTQRHRVLPMVYHNVHRWKIEIPIINDLKTAALQHSKNALQQTALLLEINKLFQDNDIECIHFKGHSLSQILYQNSTLRQCRDIDVLIERQNIMRAYNLLIKNGFETTTPLFKRNYLNIRYQTWQKDYLFNKKNCEVELHWSLSHLLDDSLNEKFFSNKNSMFFYNQIINIFDHHYYLSYLILHGYYSGWARLHWLVDIFDFIKTHNINWQIIKTIMESTHHDKALYEVVELLSMCFYLEKPLSHQVSKKLIHNTIILMQVPVKSGVLSKYDLILQYRRFFFIIIGFKNKFCYLKSTFGTAYHDWYILPLPKALFWLYYPLRPFLRTIRKIL